MNANPSERPTAQTVLQAIERIGAVFLAISPAADAVRSVTERVKLLEAHNSQLADARAHAQTLAAAIAATATATTTALAMSAAGAQQTQATLDAIAKDVKKIRDIAFDVALTTATAAAAQNTIAHDVKDNGDALAGLTDAMALIADALVAAPTADANQRHADVHHRVAQATSAAVAPAVSLSPHPRDDPHDNKAASPMAVSPASP